MRRRGAGLIRTNRLIAVRQEFSLASLIGLLFVVFLWLSGSLAYAADTSASAGRYFLVIDHSGSMLTPIPRGPSAGHSRWELMRERSAAFVDRLPAGADVWATIFSARDPAAPDRDWRRILSARLDSEASRGNLVSTLKGYPEPALANGTWLYQAEDEALTQVDIAGARDPEAYLTVMVYTDGVDEGHGRTRSEILRNPASQVSGAQINARLEQLRQKYRNFNLVRVYQPGDESIRDAEVLRLVTNRLQLASPLVLPKQDIQLEFAFRDDERVKLAGRPFTVSLESEDGRPLPLRIGGGPFTLTNGPVRLTVERSGDWPSGQDVRARLKIGYPTIPDVFLVAEGGDVVNVLIQGAEAPSISNLLPAVDSVFPVGRAVTFSLTTLPGALIRWDFGDGGAATGNPVTHAFAEPGRRTVTATVTDPRTQLSKRQTLPLVIERLGITLDPMPANVVPGREVTLSATTDGAFRRFEWNVGGRSYAGMPRSGVVVGTSLTFTPDRPGPVDISVTGEGVSGGRAEAPLATLIVREVPALRVTSPADHDALYFASTREFRAEVEGVKAERLRFTLTDASGATILPGKEVDVRQQGNVRVAVLSQRIPLLQGRTDARLRVEAVGVTPGLSREIPVSVEREPTTLEIVLPGGREPAIYHPTSIELRSNAVLSDLRWDFGDGGGPAPGSAIADHTWDRYGDYTLRASARDPDGNDVDATPVTIKIRVRPVEVRADAVYAGKSLRGDRASVPANATVGLRPVVSGDVLRLRWFMSGRELPVNAQSVVIGDQGPLNLKVVAEGTPEAGTRESSMTIRINDRALLLIAVLLSIAVFGPVMYLLWNNRWRHAEFQVKTRSDGKLDGEYRYLCGDQPHCGRWSWWTKRAYLSMASLDNQLLSRLRNEPEEVQAGVRSFKEWRVGEEIEFQGPESIRLLGGRMLELPDPQISGNVDRPWRIRYLIHRPGVHDRKYGTVEVYMRLRDGIGWFSLNWPDILNALLLVAWLLLIRWLYICYY